MKSIVLAIVLIAILVTGNALPALAAESTTPQVFLAPTVTPSPVVTLTGIAPADSFIEIFRNNRSLGITVSNDQGFFSLVTYIDEGINAFQARLVSSDGSIGAFSDTVFVTLDLVSPLPPTPDTVAAILEPTQFLFGSAESGAGVGVLLDGKLVETVPVNEQGRWQTSNLNLATGWHDFLFFVVDQAGNQSIYSPLVKTVVQEISPDVSAALDRLQELGIVRGYADGSFRPLSPITRAEFATFLARAQAQAQNAQANIASPTITAPTITAAITTPSITPSAIATPQFPDLPEDYWAREAIAQAAASGWMNGFSDGSFRPEAYITGKEVIAAIVRAAGLEREVETAQALMTNAPWYAGYSVVGAQHGLLYAQFTPDENALRGEVATSLITLYDLLTQKRIT
ncbi:MAG: S-layer homology domain-containing protein [Coprothermobacterota bacterium]|nr:S-layer homology domain-containing protein [Coprothermobacterota bacterium]